MDGLPELARRIAELDAEPFAPRASAGSRADITHFITVLERVTSTGTPTDIRAFPCVSAADADAIMAKSRLLARLAGAVPEIVTGPLRYDSQYWIAAGKPSFLPKGEPVPSKSRFIGALDATAVEASTKPFGIGLFTSTGVLGTHGMWRAYLDLNRGSTLFPTPWRTWLVEPRHEAVVREVTSASQWGDLVLSHPRRERGLVFPDWRSVARECDAVHMTLRAIAATQGLHLSTEKGVVAAPYWDVESTLWLRWCFDAARHVEVVA